MYWVSLMENRGFQDVEPLFYGHEHCGPEQSFGPIVRDYWMIYYVDAGKGTFASDDRIYEVHEKQLFFVRPGASTRIVADRHTPWFFHWIALRGTLCDQLDTLPLVMDLQTDLFRSMDHVEEYGDMKESYLTAQIHLLLCQLFPGGTEHPYIKRAKLYLRNHCMAVGAVQELAQELNLDRRYLARLFRQEMGMTMQQFQMEARMRYASRLLEQGYNCSQTAELTGYSDIAAFSRAYRKFFGYTPKQKKWSASCL